MTVDSRIDDYIARKAWARPILERLRALMAEETIKWGAPAWTYRGRMLAGMAAHSSHASFGFWRGEEVGATARDGMGQFGRIESVDDLPEAAAFREMLDRALALSDSGATGPRAPKRPRADIAMPDDLRAALEANRDAAVAWEAFAPSCRREYLAWVTEAKRPETRARRIEQTVVQTAERKSLHWRYQSR